MKRSLLIIFGILCVLAGTVGTVVPGLPTTPFLLLASWLFYQSSPRLRNKLLASWLGTYIRDYEKQKGITLRKKVWIIIFMSLMCTISVVFFIHSAILRWVVALAGIIGGLVVLFCVPTVENTKHQNDPKN